MGIFWGHYAAYHREQVMLYLPSYPHLLFTSDSMLPSMEP